MLGDLWQLLRQDSGESGVAGHDQQRGACTGEAEGCAGGADQSLDFFIVRDQLFPVFLMEQVLQPLRRRLDLQICYFQKSPE